MKEDQLSSNRAQRCKDQHQRCLYKKIRVSNSGHPPILLSLCSTLLLFLIMNHWLVMVCKASVLKVISDNPELTMFREAIAKDKVVEMMLEEWSMTVFAPNNQAMKAYLEKNQNGLTTILFKYHFSSSTIKRDLFANYSSIISLEGQLAPLYLSVTENGAAGKSTDDRIQYYVNNALILDAKENIRIKDRYEQTLFIIDEVLQAFYPKSKVLPTALDLFEEPSNYDMDNLDLSTFVDKIKSNKMQSLFTESGLNTFFAPNKISSSKNLDEYVLKAHVIKGKALFVRTMGDRRAYKTMANDDDVDVEVSFINKTIRFTAEQVYYIQSNTVKNNAVHKPGRVLSRLLKANIPVKNGVIHIIEKPLMLMDMSIRNSLSEQPKLKRFHRLLEKHSDVLREIDSNPNKTVLAPDDNAFNNLMDNNQNFAGISEDSEEMKKLLRQHVVYQQVSSSDLKRNSGFGNFTSASGVPVVFRLVGSEPNQRLTVESGGVNATSLLSDLGASDGIFHIIDRVLGMPFNTIYEKLINNPMLNETFKIGSQGGTQNWNAKLADQNKRYTFFAPSNEAWMQFGKDNPSEFKQLDMGIYPSIARAILDRHLSAKGQYNKKDLEQTVKKVDTIQGELMVSPDPATRDIYIEWGGKRAKIIKSDIYGLNGVVHVIDQVLAIRRDFKVNSAYLPQFCHWLQSVTIMSLLFAIWIHNF